MAEGETSIESSSDQCSGSVKGAVEEKAGRNGVDSNSESENEETVSSQQHPRLDQAESFTFTRQSADGTSETIEGTFFNECSYRSFLLQWCSVTSFKIQNVCKEMILSREEQRRLAIPSSHSTLHYSHLTICGLPPIEFFGVGFGLTATLALWASSRELVARLYHASLVTPSQYVRIGQQNTGGVRLSRSQKKINRFEWNIVKRNVSRMFNLMKLDCVPDSLITLTHSDTLDIRIVSKLRKALTSGRAELQRTEGPQNARIRRKRKTADTLEAAYLDCKKNRLIKVVGVNEKLVPKDELSPTKESGHLLESCDSVDAGCDVSAVGGSKMIQNGEVIKNNNALNSSKDSDVIFVREVFPKAASECDNAMAEREEEPVINTNSFDFCLGDSDADIEVVEERPSSPGEKALQEKYSEMNKMIGVSAIYSTRKVFAEIKELRNRYPKEFEAFDKHIWSHFALNGQDDRTFTWKMQARQKLLKIIREVYPHANVMAVGSTVNACGAYNSDMDLCLCLPDPNQGYNTSRKYAVNVLRRIADRFRRRSSMNIIRVCNFIDAKVPILKLMLQKPYDELEVDMNCNNVAGIYNSFLVHNYARIDDRFPALCLVVKHWAIKAGINDAMHGTFNSYSIILMVLHFLQCAVQPAVLPNLQKIFPEKFSDRCSISNLELFLPLPGPLPKLWTLSARELNDNSIGELLIAFFDYYARFDFVHRAISVCRGTTFDRRHLPRNSDRYKIFVEEPFDGLNTARCVTSAENSEKIKDSFIAARMSFLRPEAGPPRLSMINVE
ncbi:hypothetical protein AB6A40_002741 [Gnathostoma spinigerum]|uniref:PAP-associated domain-containing protein n=1 Tax=Gnathostoma spinigerum TaxID=75299 RepID=A0ABD6E9Q1_9BILA